MRLSETKGRRRQPSPLSPCGPMRACVVGSMNDRDFRAATSSRAPPGSYQPKQIPIVSPIPARSHPVSGSSNGSAHKYPTSALVITLDQHRLPLRSTRIVRGQHCTAGAWSDHATMQRHNSATWTQGWPSSDRRRRITASASFGVDPVWWTPKMRAWPSRWESDATPPTVLLAGVQG